jgi:hypothetical protein
MTEPPLATEPPPSRAPALDYESPSSHPSASTRESRNSASSPPVAISAEDDREDTLVGEVAKDLLDLSSMEGDENTRAYQAPAELIELARRQREERLLAKGKPARAPALSSPSRAAAAAPSRAPAVSQSAAPPVNPSRAPAANPSGARRGRSTPAPCRGSTANTFRPQRGVAAAATASDADLEELRTATVPMVMDSVPPSSDADGAAPPVARSRPTRSMVSEEPSGKQSATKTPASLSETGSRRVGARRSRFDARGERGHGPGERTFVGSASSVERTGALVYAPPLGADRPLVHRGRLRAGALARSVVASLRASGAPGPLRVASAGVHR